MTNKTVSTLSITCILLLTSCGGGGGSSNNTNNSQNTNPSITLAFGQPSSLPNEEVTLTWSSTDVSNCSLIADTTENVASSGSKIISFAIEGTKTSTISCAGSSKQLTASAILTVAKATTYSIPVDISKVTYPTSYTNITTKTSDISTDPCKLDYTIVTYPQSWNGSYELPTIKGAPLSSSFKRGMYMKDIMLTNNPTFNNGCSGSLKSEFDKSIARLKKLNVEYAYIPQWHWIGTNGDGSWYIMRAEDTFGPLSDSDLSYFVKAAHAANIKVIMMNQIQGLRESNGSSIIPDANLTNYRKWFDAYQAYILERAPYFQSLGIDIWELGCNACVFMDQGTGSTTDQVFFASEYEKLLPKMKDIFKGQIAFGAGGANWLINTPSILDSIDVVVTGLWDNNFLPNASQPLTVNNLKANFNTNAIQFDRVGKSVLIALGTQSRANWFTLRGYVEETGCTSSVNAINTSNSACIQKDTSPDFSLQAIYYEAAFEYLSNIAFKGSVIIGPGDMWETDSMISNSVFPNIGATVRNKPAEGIIKSWYAH